MTLVLAVEVVMEELGGTWDDLVAELTMRGTIAGEDIMEELTAGEDIMEELTVVEDVLEELTVVEVITSAVVESGARSESSSAWVDTTLSLESESA